MSRPSVVDFSAESHESFDDAIRVGLAQAEHTLGSVHGAWVERKVLIDGQTGAPCFHVDLKVALVDFFE